MEMTTTTQRKLIVPRNFNATGVRMLTKSTDCITFGSQTLFRFQTSTELPFHGVNKVRAQDFALKPNERVTGVCFAHRKIDGLIEANGRLAVFGVSL